MSITPYTPTLAAKHLRTSADALAWAVAFAQSDLRDPAAAQTGLRAFLGFGNTAGDRGGVLVNQLVTLEVPGSTTRLRQLSREMREILETLIACREAGRGVLRGVVFRDLRVTLTDASGLVPRRRWRGPRAPVLVWVDGPVRDVALFLLLRLLESLGTDAVRRCAACERLTVARRADRRYCSARCRMRDYMRRYRAAGYQPVGRSPKRGSR
ncbi:MAG TPA: hypothetical protein VNI83_10560 [Vicinamibacterales bacterium]|nr:hypothetical protein [Vicinamibacterales bacterium]